MMRENHEELTQYITRKLLNLLNENILCITSTIFFYFVFIGQNLQNISHFYSSVICPLVQFVPHSSVEQLTCTEISRQQPKTHSMFISLHAVGFILIRISFSCNQIALEVDQNHASNLEPLFSKFLSSNELHQRCTKDGFLLQFSDLFFLEWKQHSEIVVFLDSVISYSK